MRICTKYILWYYHRVLMIFTSIQLLKKGLRIYSVNLYTFFQKIQRNFLGKTFIIFNCLDLQQKFYLLYYSIPPKWGQKWLSVKVSPIGVIWVSLGTLGCENGILALAYFCKSRYCRKIANCYCYSLIMRGRFLIKMATGTIIYSRRFLNVDKLRIT